MTDEMYKAYVEAVYFTETGELDQPSGELTPLFKSQAYAACRNFVYAAQCSSNPAQLGHDLWLTRNGHGAGFWDRPEVYGEELAKVFTMMAEAMGPHDAEFLENSK